MKKLLFETEAKWSGMLARLGAGLILLPHGAQKMLGIFGGYGFGGTMNFFTETMHLPWIIAFLVIFIEFFGSLALLAGFAGRLWAMLNIILMSGIIVSSHWQYGFFMNWFGTQGGEGFEFHLLMITLNMVVLVSGSGRYSVDRLIFSGKGLSSEIPQFS